MYINTSLKRFGLATLLLSAVLVSHAQITKEGKGNRGYFRLGLNNFGADLEADYANLGGRGVLNSMVDGAYGAGTGYALEFGRNYYFNKKSLLPIFDARIGLDWTQLALTYNELDWSETIAADEAEGYTVDASNSLAISASSKIGPVFSIAPIGKLVVDVRIQLAATYFVNTTDYWAYKEDDYDDERYFSFIDDSEDSEDASLFQQFAEFGKFGFKPNYGVTVRYGGLGLALDYSPGSIKTKYFSSEGNGEEPFKNNMLQFKLSLTL